MKIGFKYGCVLMLHLSTALLLACLAVYLRAHELERRLQVAKAQHFLLLCRVSVCRRYQWRIIYVKVRTFSCCDATSCLVTLGRYSA